MAEYRLGYEECDMLQQVMTSSDTRRTEQRVAAAFFDLDRTLISRPTPIIHTNRRAGETPY